jgi:hypothetical protein
MSLCVGVARCAEATPLDARRQTADIKNREMPLSFDMVFPFLLADPHGGTELCKNNGGTAHDEWL